MTETTETGETAVALVNRQWDALSPYAREQVAELYERRWGHPLSSAEFKIERLAEQLAASIRSQRASW